MKRLLLGLAVLATACAGSGPIEPSGDRGAASQAQSAGTVSGSGANVPTVEPLPGGPTATAPAPVFTLTGPRDCARPGIDPMRWLLTMSDAGPSPVRFVALVHEDVVPGCEPTTMNPRARIDIGGVLEYTPHSSGLTTFTFDPTVYSCGRVQVDISLFDDAGNEQLLVGMVVNYGTACASAPPPAPPPPGGSVLACGPPTQSVPVGQTANVSATGGAGNYTWSAPGGSTAAGAGTTFGTNYSTAGARTITVASAAETATCEVAVTPPPAALACAPPTQTVNVNQTASVAATGGSGSYQWSAPDGLTLSGVGSAFGTAYSTAGTRTITVASGTETAACQVVVAAPAPLLACAPPTQTVAVNQAAAVSATGGTGSYEWSAPGGSVLTGTGAAFSTAYAAAGTFTIAVASGTQTAACQVVVPPIPLLACAPPTQAVITNQSADVSAIGGTGSYEWSAPGGSLTTGTGTSFSTAYAGSGTFAISLTSGAQTTACQVVVSPPIPLLECAPPTQRVRINRPAAVSATGGTGSYDWTAPGAAVMAGTGAAFTTSYVATGAYTATVTSGLQSASCQVNAVISLELVGELEP